MGEPDITAEDAPPAPRSRARARDRRSGRSALAFLAAFVDEYESPSQAVVDLRSAQPVIDLREAAPPSEPEPVIDRHEATAPLPEPDIDVAVVAPEPEAEAEPEPEPGSVVDVAVVAPEPEAEPDLRRAGPEPVIDLTGTAPEARRAATPPPPPPPFVSAPAHAAQGAADAMALPPLPPPLPAPVRMRDRRAGDDPYLKVLNRNRYRRFGVAAVSSSSGDLLALADLLDRRGARPSTAVEDSASEPTSA